MKLIWLNGRNFVQAIMKVQESVILVAPVKGITGGSSGLVQAAHAAVKCKDTYLKAVYQRLVKRRGKKKAIVAIAHRILKAAYHILTKQEPYRDLGANYLDSYRPDKLLKRLCHRIEQLGYQVALEATSQNAG